MSRKPDKGRKRYLAYPLPGRHEVGSPMSPEVPMSPWTPHLSPVEHARHPALRQPRPNALGAPRVEPESARCRSAPASPRTPATARPVYGPDEVSSPEPMSPTSAVRSPRYPAAAAAAAPEPPRFSSRVPKSPSAPTLTSMKSANAMEDRRPNRLMTRTPDHTSKSLGSRLRNQAPTPINSSVHASARKPLARRRVALEHDSDEPITISVDFEIEAPVSAETPMTARTPAAPTTPLGRSARDLMVHNHRKPDWERTSPEGAGRFTQAIRLESPDSSCILERRKYRVRLEGRSAKVHKPIRVNKSASAAAPESDGEVFTPLSAMPEIPKITPPSSMATNRKKKKKKKKMIGAKAVEVTETSPYRSNRPRRVAARRPSQVDTCDTPHPVSALEPRSAPPSSSRSTTPMTSMTPTPGFTPASSRFGLGSSWAAPDSARYVASPTSARSPVVPLHQQKARLRDLIANPDSHSSHYPDALSPSSARVGRIRGHGRSVSDGSPSLTPVSPQSPAVSPGTSPRTSPSPNQA